MSKPVAPSLPPPSPEAEAFADLTYAWLEELADDYERCMGEPFEGGAGVVFASDVLLELHGREASWDQFDVTAFESFVRERAPGFVVALPSMLADLTAFTNLLARRGRIAPERATATYARLLTLARPYRGSAN